MYNFEDHPTLIAVRVCWTRGGLSVKRKSTTNSVVTTLTSQLGSAQFLEAVKSDRYIFEQF